MKPRTLTWLLFLLVMALAAHANNSEQNVVGAVTAISANTVTVETVGKTRQSLTIALLPTTKFIRDGATVSAKDVKVGAQVVAVVKPNGDKPEAVRIVFGTVFEHMDMHHQ